MPDLNREGTTDVSDAFTQSFGRDIVEIVYDHEKLARAREVIEQQLGKA